MAPLAPPADLKDAATAYHGIVRPSREFTLGMPDSSEAPTPTRSEATANARSGVSFATVVFALMFLTGNCDACSGTNRDYLGDAVDAMSH